MKNQFAERVLQVVGLGCFFVGIAMALQPSQAVAVEGVLVGLTGLLGSQIAAFALSANKEEQLLLAEQGN